LSKIQELASLKQPGFFNDNKFDFLNGNYNTLGGKKFRESFDEDFGDEIRNKIRRALEDIDPDQHPEDTLEFDSEDMLKELERLEKEEKDS
jgi:hypothetical protein